MRTMKHARISRILTLTAIIGLSGTAAVAQVPDEQAIRMHYSLYYELYKNADYAAALPDLRWMLENAPTAPFGNDRNLERAVKTYSELAKASESGDLGRAYADTALTILRTAVGVARGNGVEVDEFEWTLRRGRFLQEFQSVLEIGESEIADEYRRAFDLDAERLDPYYLNYFIADLVQNRGDKEAALDFVGHMQRSRANDEAVADLADRWLAQVLTEPAEVLDYLLAKLEKNPDDKELMHRAFDSALEVDRAKAYEIGERILNSDPSNSFVIRFAGMFASDGDNERSATLLRRALASATTDEEIRDIEFNLGVAEQSSGRLSKARTHFRKAVAADPDFAAGYIAIGDLYVNAVSSCDTFEKRDQAVYWLAADYFDRALRADASSSTAKQRISTYSKYFPDAEAKHFMMLKPGQEYAIEGSCYAWIAESTTVR